MSNDRQTVYLIDGSAYIFRAFYAVPPLTNQAGMPTNALYGFTNMLVKLLESADSNNILMFFDAGKKTFRNDLYSAYKANRGDCPEDLVPQMPYFPKISEAFGIKTIMQVGLEADDLIGTLSDYLAGLDYQVVIVSADKDLTQLVSERVRILDTMRDRVFDPASVKEKFGVGPEKIVDFLGLTGDTSDNIPGVSGVGPKSATALINEYGDIEGIIEAARSGVMLENKSIRSRKKIAETINNDPAIVRLSRQLVTIKRDCAIDLNNCLIQATKTEVVAEGQASFSFTPEESAGQVEDSLSLLNATPEQIAAFIVREDPGAAQWDQLRSQFGFKVSVPGLSAGTGGGKVEAQADYVTVTTENYQDFLNDLRAQKLFSVDLETSDLEPLDAKLVGAAFCWSRDTAYYLPLAHHQITPEQKRNSEVAKLLPGQVDLTRFVADLKPVLEDSQVQKIGQNLKYDFNVLLKYQITMRGISFDSMLAEYLLKPDGGSYNLTALAKNYLNLDMTEYTEVVEKGQSFASVSLAEATHYAAQDAHYVWLLAEPLTAELERQGLATVLTRIEVPLLSILGQMEANGIRLDLDFLNSMNGELTKRLTVLEQEIYQQADGVEFNLNSPKQLGEILFDQLDLPTAGIKKTKTGYSTNVVTLEKLAPLHPMPAKLLEYRELFKLKSTYVESLPKHIRADTGRLHGKFNQTVTATGRLSSSKPNLQNIPIQGEIGRKIRKSFIAAPGCLLVSADYSQVELRILAHLSQDKNLLAAFKNNVDVHSKTAGEILGIDPSEVTGEQRRIGKVINFGIIYGMSSFRLGRELEISVQTSKDYIEQYFEVYSGVREYFDRLERQLTEDGYVETMLGRKRFLRDIDTAGRDKGFLVRAALNAPIQGSAADIVKLAMINIDRADHGFGQFKLILQVHDELLYEVAEQDVEAAKAFVVEKMRSAYDLSVPLEISADTGTNWGDIH